MSIAHVELRDLFLNLVDESLSIVDIEFAVDMRDMRFDGAIGQAEYLANIRTASALSQKEEYLAFAGGKIVPLRDFQMVFRQGFADALLYRGFVGLGRSRSAVFFSLLRKAFIVAPLTLLLPGLGMGVDGVFAAEPVSNVLGGLACRW